MQQRQYDYSEFAPEAKKSYDFSEFSPKEDNSLKNIEMSHMAQNLPGMAGLAANAYEKVQKAPHALGEVAQDVWDLLKKAPKAAVQGIGNIPKDIDYLKENIPEAGSLIKNDPLSAAKSAVGGGMELAGQISRVPPNLMNYLSKIGMIKPETAKNFPQPFSEQEVEKEANKLIGEEKPGGELIRGAVRNIPAIMGAGKIAQTLNPMRYTNKAILKDVLGAKARQKRIHTEEYNKLWNQADKEGLNKVHLDSKLIDLDTIKKYSLKKYYGATEKLMADTSLPNAQKAQSDLGKLIRDMNKRTTLTSEERATLNAAEEAQNHIKDRMFKNQKGEINLPLKNRYDVITKSYGENVIPYSGNKALQDFKRKDITLDELVQKLSGGKFAAKKGYAHPQIGRKSPLKTAGKVLLGGTALHYLGLDQPLIDRLINKHKD